MIEKEEHKEITIKNKRLIINDLTNYPFTKKVYELNDLKTVKRRVIIDIDASSE